MKLYDQVCSLELAKRLKELGAEQNSLFFYRADENPLIGQVSEDKVHDNQWILYYYDDKYSKCCDWHISAFTASELGSMIPQSFYNFYKFDDKYCFSINGEPNTYDINLANAMAKMIIYLIENNLMEIK